MGEPRPLEGRDAIYAGWVAGIARANGIDVVPVCAEDGRVTDHLTVTLRHPHPKRAAPVVVTFVVPPCPADWLGP